MTDERKPTYRSGPSLPSRTWERDKDPAHYYWGRHKADCSTPVEARVAALVERHRARAEA